MHLQQAIMLRRPPKIDAFRLSNEQTEGEGEIEEGEERRAAGGREGEAILLPRSPVQAKVGLFYTQLGEILRRVIQVR